MNGAKRFWSNENRAGGCTNPDNGRSTAALGFSQGFFEPHNPRHRRLGGLGKGGFRHGPVTMTNLIGDDIKGPYRSKG